MWCYRRILRISWTTHTTTNWCKGNNYAKHPENIKLSYAGHIRRNTSGHHDNLLTTIEGRLNGKRRSQEGDQDEHGSTISETGLAPNDTIE